MEVTIIPWKTIRHNEKYWILLNVLSHLAKLSIKSTIRKGKVWIIPIYIFLEKHRPQGK